MEDLKLYLLFAAGVVTAIMIRKISEIAKAAGIRKDREKQFAETIECIKEGRSVFVSRLNMTSMVDLKLKDYGKVNIVYLMDKKIFCIFKEGRCLHSTEGMKGDTPQKLEEAMMLEYGKQIKDVVQVLGVTISREELESQVRKFEEELKGMNLGEANLGEIANEEESDVQKIISENESMLDVDSILDKINRVGIKKLTKEEIEFLNSQSQK